MVDYIATQPDTCVKEMAGRMLRTEGGLTAIFPVKRLNHSFMIGGFGMPKLNPEKEKEAEERKKVEERKMDTEHPGEALNRVLSCLDGLSAKFDSINARMDAMDAARKDGAEAAMVDKRKDGDLEEEGTPRPLKADSRADSLPRTISDSERDELAEIQSRADAVCSAWNLEARKPMQNELTSEYRRRVAIATVGKT